MKRRTFITQSLSVSIVAMISGLPAPSPAQKKRKTKKGPFSAEQSTRMVFADIINQAESAGWDSLEMGRLVGTVATVFLGYQYKGGTLENPEKEICKVDFSGLDCVTLCENALCLARIIKKGKRDYASFIDELTYTRYRGGRLTDYSSRLHYTADWINDNVRKNVVEDVSRSIGGSPLDVEVSFMSGHPQYYAALKRYPELVPVIAGIEQDINAREHWYIPAAGIQGVEAQLHTGDFIAIVTDKKGLDYAHTGLIYKDESNVARLLHASSTHKKVMLDGSISEYVNSVESHIGISVARPLEV